MPQSLLMRLSQYLGEMAVQVTYLENTYALTLYVVQGSGLNYWEGAGCNTFGWIGDLWE